MLLDRSNGYREKKLFEIPRFKSLVMFALISIESSIHHVPNRHKFNLSTFFSFDMKPKTLCVQYTKIKLKDIFFTEVMKYTNMLHEVLLSNKCKTNFFENEWIIKLK